jgi:hypothetical protein
MVNIALGNADVSICPAGDPNNDKQVTVDEILTAVNNALNGCPPAIVTPSPSPTATATPFATTPPSAATPTGTATAGAQTSPGPGSAVSGQTSVAIGAVSVIGDVVAAIASGYQLGTASSALPFTSSLMTPADPGLGQAAAACPGGTGTVTKTGDPVFGTMSITFSNDCALPTFDGTVAFNGTASVGLFSGVNVNVTADFRTSGTWVEHVVADVHGPLKGYTPVASGGSCFLTGVKLELTGTLSSTTTPPSGPNASVTFTATTLDVSNIAFNSACVPTAFDLILTGPGGLLATGGSLVNVTFNNLTLHVDSSGNPTTMMVNGGMTSPSCFGGTTTLATSTTLTIPSHQNCPTAGLITATLPQGGSATITFGAGGSVQIQSPMENLSAPNCLDPKLLACVA